MQVQKPKKEKKIKPLEVKKLKMSPTGELSINFSKPVLIRTVSEALQFKDGRKLEVKNVDLSQAVNVYIEGDQDDADFDKSIVDVRMLQPSET